VKAAGNLPTGKRSAVNISKSGYSAPQVATNTTDGVADNTADKVNNITSGKASNKALDSVTQKEASKGKTTKEKSPQGKQDTNNKVIDLISGTSSVGKKQLTPPSISQGKYRLRSSKSPVGSSGSPGNGTGINGSGTGTG
jgi:hypothetical protein